MKLSFPWLALGTGLPVALLLLGGSGLPLLTRLMAAEFGFVLTLAGALSAVRGLRSGGRSAALLPAAAGCGLLSLGFLWLGLQLWPQ